MFNIALHRSFDNPSHGSATVPPQRSTRLKQIEYMNSLQQSISSFRNNGSIGRKVEERGWGQRENNDRKICFDIELTTIACF